jgi:hypothetical protein
MINSTLKPRIKLLGDHSKYHCGCKAVIHYLQNELRTVGTLTNENDYDILVVNGEGSMHHSTKTFFKKMTALKQAISQSKAAYLINTVWQSNTHEFDYILKCLNGITVREQMSCDDLLNHHGVQSVIRLDASYWAEIDESSPYQHFGSSVIIGDFYSKFHKRFVRIESEKLKKYPYVNMNQIYWSSLVKGLRTASLFVTGRHHGVFAACRARIPFVAIMGNSHKIEGMVKMSRLPIPVCTVPKELETTMQWALENKTIYDDFFAWMDEQPRLCPTDLGL